MKPTFPTRLVVEVTEEDISGGLIDSCGSCPIALAVKRRFPDLFPRVTGNHVHLLDGPEEIYTTKKVAIYDHSDESHGFVRRFDTGADVHPAVFTLPLIPL
jgi:hypothetical protein